MPFSYKSHSRKSMTDFKPRPPQATKGGCIAIIILIGIIIVLLILGWLGLLTS